VEKDTNEGIRVFTLAKRALFISTYQWASGEARPKIYFQAFKFFKVQMVKKDQRIKEKDTYKKKKGMRKYLSRSTVHLVFDSRACVIRKKGKNN
jgi:hypothetical protein